jgi:O-antigen/teichoic acid export membrane protein
VFVVSDKLVFLFTSVMAQVLRVLTAFVMARLLVPEDYGLLTLISVAPGFLAALGDCGVARALVQYRDLPTEITEATGLVISAALGTFYAVIFVASGFYFWHHGYAAHGVWIQHDDRLPWIGLVTGSTVLLASVYNFQMACLNRDLRFKSESLQNAVFAVALAVTGLSMALIAHRHRAVGVFAVALQPLVAQFMGNAVIYHRHRFHWPRAFSIGMAKKMLNYGWKVTLAQYTNNLQQQVVSAFVVIIGGVYGTGVFGRATQISDMIAVNLTSTMDRLLHPLLRSVREDRERLRATFIRGCVGISILCCFGWAWIAGTAPDLVRVVMGPQWVSVPPLLRIICTVILFTGLGTMGVVVSHALGRPLAWLRFGLLNLAILFVAMGLVMVLHRDLKAVTMAYCLTLFIYAMCLWIWAIRTLQVEPVKMIGHIARLLFAGILTFACIILVRRLFTAAVLRLLISSTAGALIYLGLVLLIDRDAILDFRSLVQRRKAPLGGSIVEPVESLVQGETAFNPQTGLPS